MLVHVSLRFLGDNFQVYFPTGRSLPAKNKRQTNKTKHTNKKKNKKKTENIPSVKRPMRFDFGRQCCMRDRTGVLRSPYCTVYKLRLALANDIIAVNLTEPDNSLKLTGTF